MGSKQYFVEGLAALINLYTSTEEEPDLQASINERIKKNWESVGDNMRQAIGQYGEAISPCKKGDQPDEEKT